MASTPSALERMKRKFTAVQAEELEGTLDDLLERSPGTLTEANITVVALAGRRWPIELIRSTIAAIPPVGNVVRVQPPTSKLIESGLRVTLKNFEVAKQAELVRSLIELSTLQLLEHVPPGRHTVYSRALKTSKDEASSEQRSFETLLLWSEAQDPKTTSDRLAKLALMEDFVRSEASGNRNFTTEDLTAVLATEDKWSKVWQWALPNPNLAQEIADEMFDPIRHEHAAATVNVSGMQLRELLEEEFARPYFDERLEGMIANRNFSAETLLWAEKRILVRPSQPGLDLLYGNPAFPAEVVNSRMSAMLNNPEGAFPGVDKPLDHVLTCAGHPELELTLQQYFVEQRGWKALSYLALTDQLIDALPGELIENQVTNMHDEDLAIFERLAERGRLGTIEWSTFQYGTAIGASWAASHPMAPSDVALPYAGDALVKEQALAVTQQSYEPRDPVLVSSWTELSDSKLKAFDAPAAVVNLPSMRFGAVTLNVLRNQSDVDRMPAAAQSNIAYYLKQNIVMIEVSVDNEIRGIGLVSFNRGQFELFNTWSPEEPDGRPFSMDATFEPMLLALSNTWTTEQARIIVQGVTDSGPGLIS